MKIIVYNFKDQYALSRHQIETIYGIIPKEYFAPVAEFHLTYDTSRPSSFEYSYETKSVHFAYPVKEKSAEVASLAIAELLIGLARIKAKSRFGIPLKHNEQVEYLSFVETWHAKCVSAIS